MINYESTYDLWVGDEGTGVAPDLLFEAASLPVLLTCDPTSYARAMDALERQGEVDCLASSPVPISPLEFEALRTLRLEAEVSQEMASRGLGDTVEIQSPHLDPTLDPGNGPGASWTHSCPIVGFSGDGAVARCSRQTSLTLLAKAFLGGKLVDAGRGAEERVLAEVSREAEGLRRAEEAKEKARGRGHRQHRATSTSTPPPSSDFSSSASTKALAPSPPGAVQQSLLEQQSSPSRFRGRT